MNLTRHFQITNSVVALVLSNLVTIFFAVVQIWDIFEVMLVYWGQSIIIGVFNGKRILDLKQFSTKGFRVNNQPVKPTRATQVSTAWFFFIHYGFFHFGYLIFLLSQEKHMSGIAIFGITICILVFLVNHGFSYRQNRQKDLSRTPNIGTIMFFPYARIIPMHFTIIFGSSLAGDGRGTLIFFLGLKTLADVIMHMVEHYGAKRQQVTHAGL